MKTSSILFCATGACRSFYIERPPLVKVFHMKLPPLRHGSHHFREKKKVADLLCVFLGGNKRILGGKHHRNHLYFISLHRFRESYTCKISHVLLSGTGK